MSPLPSRAACRRASLVAMGLVALCRPAAAEGETDFVKAALAHGGFKAFVGLVSRAGLADTLGASPVTVFMPTDGAFARLSATQRRSIADLSPDGVKAFVGRFVFPGTAMASNDVDKTITSEDGTTFDVTWYQGRLSLRDHRGPATSRLAFVVDGDIPAGSGVIDAVDSVLMSAATDGVTVPVAGAAPAGGTAPAVSPATATMPAPGTSAVPGTPAPTPVPVPSTAPMPAAAVPAAPPADQPKPVPGVSPSAPVAVSAAPAVVVVVPPVVAVPPKPEVSVAAAGLRGWPVKVSGNGSTGKVNGVMVGLPDGRVTGLTAHFGGFFGLGGRDVFVPWDRVTPDTKGHVLRARMTAAEFAAAPGAPPKP